MTAPVVQITDCHLGSEWIDARPLDTLRTVVAAIRALPDRPQAVLVTGDLTNDGDPSDYGRVAAVLAELDLPLFAIPGNHDSRSGLRGAFDLPGEGEEPIQYAVELEGLRVVMLDTQRPGTAAGELGPDRLAWLAGELSSRAQTPTLVAMHHPPFITGIRGMDAIGLPAADRTALGTLLADHPQVVGLVTGHVHRAITGSLAGRPVVTVPSTYGQLGLDLTRTDLPMVARPLAFALHLVVDGRLVSHVESISI
jgi:3',5'-cyclic AMP phosphodiesterase CpdA